MKKGQDKRKPNKYGRATFPDMKNKSHRDKDDDGGDGDGCANGKDTAGRADDNTVSSTDHDRLPRLPRCLATGNGVGESTSTSSSLCMCTSAARSASPLGAALASMAVDAVDAAAAAVAAVVVAAAEGDGIATLKSK